MFRSSITRILFVATLALACTAPNEPASASAGGASSSSDRGFDAGPLDASSSLPVWRRESRRIELWSFGYWQGSSGYAKDRAKLTDQQLAALEGLRATTPPSARGADFTSYRIRVLDEDGTFVDYRAAEGNVHDSDESDAARLLPTIDFATLEPFLATFQCLSAKAAAGTPRETEAPIDPSEAEMEDAARLPADTGCINGLFVPHECSDTILTFDVSAPAVYDIVGGRCLESLSLRLYARDRTTLLALSSPAADGACFTLRHAFDPGRYVLVLSKTNVAGCTTTGRAGDVSLRVQQAE